MFASSAALSPRSLAARAAALIAWNSARSAWIGNTAHPSTTMMIARLHICFIGELPATNSGYAKPVSAHNQAWEPTLKPKTIIFLVCPDPEPRDYFAVTQAKRAIMIAHANHADAVTPLLEVEGRMIRV